MTTIVLAVVAGTAALAAEAAPQPVAPVAAPAPLAPPAPLTPPAPVAAVTPIAAKKADVVCRTSVDTGSLIAHHKTCQTRKQWTKTDDQSQDEARRFVEENRWKPQ